MKAMQPVLLLNTTHSARQISHILRQVGGGNATAVMPRLFSQADEPMSKGSVQRMVALFPDRARPTVFWLALTYAAMSQLMSLLGRRAARLYRIRRAPQPVRISSCLALEFAPPVT